MNVRGSLVELFPPELFEPTLYKMEAAHGGRLSEYLGHFKIPPLKYRNVHWGKLVSKHMIGITRHCTLIHETIPFKASPNIFSQELNLRQLTWKQYFGLRLRSVLPEGLLIRGAACSLIDLRKWSNSYFHWFIDVLPRVLAAQDYRNSSGNQCQLIVPHNLRSWQRDSLGMMGWGDSELIPLNPELNFRSIAVEHLIALSSRGSVFSRDLPADVMVPAVIRALHERLSPCNHLAKGVGVRRRIYLSRNDTATRKVVNEHEIMEILLGYGFVSVELEGMGLREQIALFRNATHIIAPHGAGLTNLLHVRNASVLEIFQSGHGIRPDFFQLSSILGLQYRYAVCPSLNDNNDIRIEPSIIRQHLFAVNLNAESTL